MGLHAGPSQAEKYHARDRQPQARPGSDLYEHVRFGLQGDDHTWLENEKYLYSGTSGDSVIGIKGDGNLVSSLAVAPLGLSVGPIIFSRTRNKVEPARPPGKGIVVGHSAWSG